MMTGNRNERLEADYREMLKIQDRPYLSWIVTQGEPPHAEEYLLTVRLRTYSLTASSGSYIVGALHACTIRVRLWDSYPYTAPNIKMLSIPPVFHPNWYSKGTYCPKEAWRPDMSLKDYVKRCIETLRYEPEAIELNAPANYKALDWYRKNRENDTLFPSDRTELTENTPDMIDAIEKAADPFAQAIDSWKVR